MDAISGGGGDRLGEGGTVDRDVPHPVMDRSVGPKTGGHIDDRAVVGKVLHQGLTRLFRVGAVNTRNGELNKVRPMVGPADKRNDGLVMDQTGGESGASGLGRGKGEADLLRHAENVSSNQVVAKSGSGQDDHILGRNIHVLQGREHDIIMRGRRGRTHDRLPIGGLEHWSADAPIRDLQGAFHPLGP